MIPTTRSYLDSPPSSDPQPSYTYRYDEETGRISGHVDGKEAIAQMARILCRVEKGKWPIYRNFGIQTQDLYGKPPDYVTSMLEFRINEAVTKDDRVNAMKDFEAKVEGPVITVWFTLECVDGDVGVDTAIDLQDLGGWGNV